MISATSAISKSYLVPKSMNEKHSIQEKVGSTWIGECLDLLSIFKDVLFTRPQQNLFINHNARFAPQIPSI